jgi:hypothetical protein
MVNYAHGKIYKIEAINGEPGDIYIGSTTAPKLSNRMAVHRHHYELWKEGKKTKCRSFSIFEKYGRDNCKIILIQRVNEAKTKEDLEKIEAEYIRNTPCVNKMIPLRTVKEYQEENRLKLNKKSNEYYHLNKAEISAKSKERYKTIAFQETRKHYVEKNKDAIAERAKKHANDNKLSIAEYNKRYRELNKDIIAAQGKQYRLENKEQIATQRRMKYLQQKEKKNIEN